MLSVAVINYETPDLTAGCVRSLFAAPAAEPFEVLVIDNGSSEATLKELRAIEGIRLVETGENGGFARGVNACLREAAPDSDVVIVLNSDIEVEPGTLDVLAATAREPGVGLAAPLVVDGEGRLQRTGHHRFPTLATTWAAVFAVPAYVLMVLDSQLKHPTQFSFEAHRRGFDAEHVMGAAMAINTKAWAAIGEFDEGYFMYLEETEWQLRLRAGGWRVRLVPDAQVRHLHRGGDAALAVPTLHYLDSARRYFGALGHRDFVVRAVLGSALLFSYLAFVVYSPVARFVAGHREIVRASRPAARKALRHVLRGKPLPRPDGRRAEIPR